VPDEEKLKEEERGEALAIDYCTEVHLVPRVCLHCLVQCTGASTA